MELDTGEATVLFQRMLLMQHLWTGDDARVYHKLRDWLRRQRQLDRVDENANVGEGKTDG